MAVSNEIIVVALGLAFGYLVMYPRNRLLGNVVYFSCGLALMSFSMGNIFAAIGFIIFIGGLASGILDFVTPKKKKSCR